MPSHIILLPLNLTLLYFSCLRLPNLDYSITYLRRKFCFNKSFTD